ncbi:hypothetical protein H4R99_004551 [Coemansia sp. RSA 1722]|nr:hypothetical protein LPJ57_000385 [Coemansia sp. RSA 486]KAJ2231929.1 hypothetical protein IWW45_005351 [Coemansia sp. RSA 485]KAJ2597331.1 hypothetical protein H4R99_004551 [Coemansia sp. RSA 1722]KAJ2601045.1 hypothetical protein GGF39_001465 [Coemansia sp. RSA 1721]KAJ2640297.1 hypothetical protein GGF40_000196 [Coemansia sp. RSA 1286]
MKPIFQSLALVGATFLFWLYGLHLYRQANYPLAATSAADGFGTTAQAQALLTDAFSQQQQQQQQQKDDAIVLGDSNDGIVTFIHASDVHISKYFAKGGLVHFLHFLHTAVPLISPRLVAVTGDLTDGKDRQRLTSLQQVDEWKAYQKALESTTVKTRLNGTFYRDQRGNHDCFNVFAFDSQDNYFKDYSAVRQDGYFLQIKEPFGTYSFVATDGCPKHGFARPLNFFGYLDASDMELLETRMELAAGSNHTFLLNHYPVSTMLYGRYKKSFGELVRQVSVFLCGHLHHLAGGIGAQLQAYKARDGYWELELGDMKEHAVYRVYAVDNDMVSFVDVTLPLSEIPMPNPDLLDAPVPSAIAHPPVVLVTNPKDARYLLPKHEPLRRMLTSTHIRMLIWADKPVASVAVAIDGIAHPHPAVYRGKETGSANDVIKTPLWTVPWNASSYNDGRLHHIEITAVDSEGKSTTTQVPFHFSSDLVPLDNDSRGGWIMRQSFADIFRVSGIISYLLMTVFLLLVPRLWYNHISVDIATWISNRRLEHHKDDARMRHIWTTFSRGHIINPFVLTKLLLALLSTHTKFCVSTQFTAQVYFASISWLFWPAYSFAIALATLPLFTGHLIPSAGYNGLGSVYTYGIYIAGEWAPLLDSWTYALTSIASLALLLLYLPVAVSSWSIFYSTSRVTRPWYRGVAVRLAMALFITLYMGIPTLMTVYTYGFTTLFLGYGRAWLFVAAAAALYVLDWRYTIPSSPREQSYTRVASSGDNSDIN